MQGNEFSYFYVIKVIGMAMTQFSPIDPNIFSLVIGANISGKAEKMNQPTFTSENENLPCGNDTFSSN